MCSGDLSITLKSARKVPTGNGEKWRGRIPELQNRACTDEFRVAGEGRTGGCRKGVPAGLFSKNQGTCSPPLSKLFEVSAANVPPEPKPQPRHLPAFFEASRNSPETRQHSAFKTDGEIAAILYGNFYAGVKCRCCPLLRLKAGARVATGNWLPGKAAVRQNMCRECCLAP